MEHSIEELQRQYEAAKSALNEAEQRERSARARLQAAKSKATGLKGMWLQEKSGSRRIILCKFVSDGFCGYKPSGPRLLKTGYLGESIIFSWRDFTVIDRPEYVKEGF